MIQLQYAAYGRRRQLRYFGLHIIGSAHLAMGRTTLPRHFWCGDGVMILRVWGVYLSIQWRERTHIRDYLWHLAERRAWQGAARA